MKVFLTVADPQATRPTYLSRFQDLAARDRIGAHTLTLSPEDAGVILFVDAHQHPGDWRLNVLRRHPLTRRFPEKTFVYNELDQPWCALPGLYVSMPRTGFNPQRQRACCYIANINELAEAMPGGDASTQEITEPEFLFSFMGRRCHPVRERIFELSHPRAHIEDTSRFEFFGGANEVIQQQKFHYAATVLRSKFVLCPRGSGPASFRLFETLAAGRVPVILSDDWIAPRGPDWSTFSLRVPEAQAGRVPALLENQEERFPAMARAARREWEQWFGPEVLFHRMIESCRQIMETRRVPEALWSRLPDARALRLSARAVKVRIARAQRAALSKPPK